MGDFPSSTPKGDYNQWQLPPASVKNGSSAPGLENSPKIMVKGRHCTSKVRVTYRMTDQMGYVYYGNYFEFFEIGRTDLIRGSSVTYAEMEAEGYLLPVMHAACDYKAPGRYDDVLVVTTRLTELSRVRISFAYEIHAESRPGELVCTGLTRHVIVGRDGRPRRLSPNWLERLRAFDPGPDPVV
jgi:acyl-CoA thioester hydrolase